MQLSTLTLALKTPKWPLKYSLLYMLQCGTTGGTGRVFWFIILNGLNSERI